MSKHRLAIDEAFADHDTATLLHFAEEARTQRCLLPHMTRLVLLLDEATGADDVRNLLHLFDSLAAHFKRLTRQEYIVLAAAVVRHASTAPHVAARLLLALLEKPRLCVFFPIDALREADLSAMPLSCELTRTCLWRLALRSETAARQIVRQLGDAVVRAFNEGVSLGMLVNCLLPHFQRETPLTRLPLRACLAERPMANLMLRHLLNTGHAALLATDTLWQAGVFQQWLGGRLADWLSPKPPADYHLPSLAIQCLAVDLDAFDASALSCLRQIIHNTPALFKFRVEGTSLNRIAAVLAIAERLELDESLRLPYARQTILLAERAASEERARRLGVSLELPDAFRCPLTLEPMENPVVASDGHSYERSALLQVLRANPISPLTREPLKHDIAIPNINLRKRIREFRDDLCDAIERQNHCPTHN